MLGRMSVWPQRRGRPAGAPDPSVRRGVVRGGALALLVGLGVALAPSSALAHDELVSTDPADGSTVAVAPDEVTLTFGEKPVALGAEVRVKSPVGTVVSAGDPVIDGTSVVQAIDGNRPAGTYTVTWRVTSSDGHPVDGEFTFVAEGATGGPTPTPSPTTAPTTAPTTVPTTVPTTAPTADPTTTATPAPTTSPAPTSTPTPTAPMPDATTPAPGQSDDGGLPVGVLVGTLLLVLAGGGVAWYLLRRRG